MDYERKYKEAFANARQEYNTTENVERKQWLEELFPELAESEDEKIREEIKVILANTDLSQFALDYTFADIINWLERQDKSSDQTHYWTEEEIEPIISDYLRGVEHYGGMIGRLRCLKPKSLEKQGDCSIKWQKNTPDNKPAINHSILMKTIQGIAEGEWQGEYWFQYRWSWTLKDNDVLAWMELSDLNEQGEQKPILDFKASNWYVSKVDGKIHDMTYNPADKVEPKFNIGDVLCDKSCTTFNKESQPNIEILDIRNGLYICNNCTFSIEQQDEYELVAKKIEDEIEIPFGAKDSELQEATYYIPEGFHAEIDDDKVIIKKGEKFTAWSDKDEKMYKIALSCIETLEDISNRKNMHADVKEWLKSLKDRIGG